MLYLKTLVVGPLPFLFLFHFSGFWQSKAPLLTSSYGRSLLSKSKCFSKIKVSYSFPKTLKRTSQSSVALMLTSQDLFIFSKWGGSLFNDSVAGKVPDHLPSWFSFLPLPMGIWFDRTPFVFRTHLLSWACHCELSTSGISYASLSSGIPP